MRQVYLCLPSIKDFMFNGWLNEVEGHKKEFKFMNMIEDFELLPPIPNPPKIICLAFNYYDHAKDAGLTPSDEPVIFMKPRTTLNSPFPRHNLSFICKALRL